MLENDPANETTIGKTGTSSEKARPSGSLEWVSKPVPQRVARRREFQRNQVDIEAIKVLGVLMALTIGMVLVLRALGV